MMTKVFEEQIMGYEIKGIMHVVKDNVVNFACIDQEDKSVELCTLEFTSKESALSFLGAIKKIIKNAKICLDMKDSIKLID